LPPGRATRLRGAGEKKRGFDARVRENVDAAWDSPVVIASRRITRSTASAPKTTVFARERGKRGAGVRGAILGEVAHLIGAFALGPVPIE